MTRRVALGVVLIALVVALGWAIQRDPGYVLLRYDQFQYQSSFWVFLLLIALIWLGVVIVRGVLSMLCASGSWINPWSSRRRLRRAAKASQLGQRELVEGRWEEALKHLQLAAEYDPQPLVHYLGAAKAAAALEHYSLSDELLAQARQREPSAQLSIGLTQTRLQIERGDYTAADHSLQTLLETDPQQREVLALQQQLYVEQENWTGLCQLLPTLRRYRVLPETRLLQLERLGWIASLQQITRAADHPETQKTQLAARWSSVPGNLRGDTEVVLAYARAVARLGEYNEAETVLSAAIKRQYDSGLVALYGHLPAADNAQQLKQAEKWLKDRPHDAELLLALGRICVRGALWGKAKDYYEASLAIEHRAETYAELGRLLNQLGDSQGSAQMYAQGLVLLQDHTRSE